MVMSDDETQGDADYNLPLQYRRAFGGAGKRHRHVAFVPATAPEPTIQKKEEVNNKSVGDLYLSIVMKKARTEHHAPVQADEVDAVEQEASTAADAANTLEDIATVPLCPICLLPSTSTTHSTTLAHQVCLPHAHPPSSIDRSRKGLNMLSSYGWDPDARLGLGAQGDGRLHPVQAKPRDGKAGIGGEGVAKAADAEEAASRRRKKADTRKERIKREREVKLREDKMKALVFGRDDVNEHLGVRL